MPAVSTDVPDVATRAAILKLAQEIEAEDGAPPLSDQVITHLRSPDLDHFVLRQGATVRGYAQSDGDHAELAATSDAVPALLDAVTHPELLVWSHGRRSRLVPILEAQGAERVRELYQMRRPLTDLPAQPPVAEGVVLRTFEPGRDDEAWLAVNAAAFATHPEQGRWTQADLDARIDEPWFDPAGFFLAERAGELLGYHWTKVHSDSTGEVYVLGIGPAAQGLGLGKSLLARGLHYLAEHGCPEVLLYVDGDNAGARSLYERSGFREYDLDVQWRLRPRP